MPALKGRGKIKIALFSSGATFNARQFEDIGNASGLVYSINTSSDDLLDYQDPSGGLEATIPNIDSVDGSIDVRNFSPANFAMAAWGTTAALAATAIVGETGHTIVPAKFLPTARLINTSVAPVVKKGATVISAADYVVSPAGITIAATISTATVISGDAITIDYTPQAGTDVQMLINSAPIVSVLFEGINLVNGKYFAWRAHKAKLAAPQNVGLIGTEYATMPLGFKLEKDSTIVTAGLSKFMALEIAS